MTPEQRAEEVLRGYRRTAVPMEGEDWRDLESEFAVAIRDALADADREALGAACPVDEEMLERLRRQALAMMYHGEAQRLLAALDYYRALAAALAREQGFDQQARAAYAAGLSEGKRRALDAVATVKTRGMDPTGVWVFEPMDFRAAVEAVSEEP